MARREEKAGKPPLVLFEKNDPTGARGPRTREAGKPRFTPRAPSLSTPTSPKQSPSPPQGPSSPRSAQWWDKRRPVHSSAPCSPRSSPSSPHSRPSTSGRYSATDGRDHSRQSLGSLWPSIRSLSTSVSHGGNAERMPVLKHASGAPANKGKDADGAAEDSSSAGRSNSLAIPTLVGARLHAGNATRSMERPSLSILLRGVFLPRRRQISDPKPLGEEEVDLQGSSDDCASSASAERSVSPPRAIGPVPRVRRLPSPRKVTLPPASSCRGTTSPSRVKPSSIPSYIADGRREKKDASHVEDVHQLRLLHSSHLQWRFVNARAEAALSKQKVSTEDDLYTVWLTTSKLTSSVATKNTEIQRIRQEMKLELLLKEQMEYLEEWASLEREHSTWLSETTEALKGSIIRVPITGRARADVRSVKHAINSTMDIMQATSSSICHMLSMVDGANYLLSELAKVVEEERAMLEECQQFLTSFAALQVQELSLRAHLLHLRREQLRCGSSKLLWF